MRKKSFEVQSYILLVILIQLLLPETPNAIVEIASSPKTLDVSTPEDYTSSNVAETEIKKLTTRINEIRDKFLRLSPDIFPFINVQNYVNSNSDIITVRDNLNSIFPDFWRFLKRSKCERVLDVNLATFNEDMTKEMKNALLKKTKEYMQTAIKSAARLDGMEKKLSSSTINSTRIYRKYLTNSEKNELKNIEKEIQELEDELDRLENSFQVHFSNKIECHIYGPLMRSVKKCLEEE